jgi:integrase
LLKERLQTLINSGRRGWPGNHLNWRSWPTCPDLKQRAIRLEAEDTKASEPRVIYLNDELLGILNEAGKVRGLGHNRVFTYGGRPISSISTSFRRASKKAAIINFRFHDLRHTFNTNMRKAGVDQSVIMKITGHKTPSMFQRYNTVDLADAKEAYQKLEELLRQDQEHRDKKVLP